MKTFLYLIPVSFLLTACAGWQTHSDHPIRLKLISGQQMRGVIVSVRDSAVVLDTLSSHNEYEALAPLSRIPDMKGLTTVTARQIDSVYLNRGSHTFSGIMIGFLVGGGAGLAAGSAGGRDDDGSRLRLKPFRTEPIGNGDEGRDGVEQLMYVLGGGLIGALAGSFIGSSIAVEETIYTNKAHAKPLSDLTPLRKYAVFPDDEPPLLQSYRPSGGSVQTAPSGGK